MIRSFFLIKLDLDSGLALESMNDNLVAVIVLKSQTD